MRAPLGQPDDCGLVLQGHAAPQDQPGDGAVNHARIDEAVAQFAGQVEADGRLAGRDGTINSDNGSDALSGRRLWRI